MKLYHTIVIATAAIVASAAMASPSSDFDFGGKMKSVAYERTAQVSHNSLTPTRINTPSLENKKHHSAHSKLFHKSKSKSKSK